MQQIDQKTYHTSSMRFYTKLAKNYKSFQILTSLQSWSKARFFIWKRGPQLEPYRFRILLGRWEIKTKHTLELGHCSKCPRPFSLKTPPPPWMTFDFKLLSTFKKLQSLPICFAPKNDFQFSIIIHPLKKKYESCLNFC